MCFPIMPCIFHTLRLLLISGAYLVLLEGIGNAIIPLVYSKKLSFFWSISLYLVINGRERAQVLCF